MQLHSPMQMAQSNDQLWNGLSIKPIRTTWHDAKAPSAQAGRSCHRPYGRVPGHSVMWSATRRCADHVGSSSDMDGSCVIAHLMDSLVQHALRVRGARFGAKLVAQVHDVVVAHGLCSAFSVSLVSGSFCLRNGQRMVTAAVDGR